MKQALCITFFAVLAVFILNAQQQESVEKTTGQLALQYFQQNGVTPGGGGITPEAMSSSVLVGHSSDERFGISIASAGDMNGDGYGDVIVGAHAYNSSAGRVYVYFGGLQFNTSADLILNGNAGSNFGWSVAGLGDINGDGFSDVAVGAYSENSNRGKAYIFTGGPEMDTYPDLILTGEGEGNYFGTSVAGAGDVNGDGYMDMLVGANGHNGNSGKAYIFYGAAVPDFIPDVALTGDPSRFFASKVAGIGDINGDGFADVAIGEHPWNVNAGKVFVFHGGAPMNTVADFELTGSVPSGFYGYALAGNGDINGDGYSDFVIGQYGMQWVHVFFGGATMSGVADLIIARIETNSKFGAALALSDINGDGYSDILIGAYGENSNAGKVYGYFGGANPDRICDVYIQGEETEGLFGSAITFLGDINNDGNEDFAAGAYGFSGNRGKAYIYKNSLTGTDAPDLRYVAPNASPMFGYSLTNTGDVNGDGYNDILVSSVGTGSVPGGSAFLYFGGPDFIGTSPVSFTGESAFFGAVFAGKGDINGDGFDDVVLSDAAYSNGRGRVYVYLGSAAFDNIADYTLTGVLEGEKFGQSVTKASDVNGDGYDDLLVGAPGNGSNFIGRVYLYSGGPLFSTTYTSIFYNPTTLKDYGWAVVSGGDINADGFGDFAILQNSYTQGYFRATVYYGCTGFANIFSQQINDSLGVDHPMVVPPKNISIAGDANGDGYDDLVLSDLKANSGSGRIVIYYGSQIGLTAAGATIQGETNAGLGYSLDCDGDVNGDGFDDIIVIGLRSRVYFGGAVQDGVPDIALLTPPGGRRLIHACYIGDQNRDRITDFCSVSIEILLGEVPGMLEVYLSSSPKAAPRIALVADIPNDQGGKVNIRFVRSGFDSRNTPKAIYYYVERSNPPVAGQYAWENMGTLSALNNLYYNVQVATQADSAGGSAGLHFFRVTARPYNNATEYWRSNIMAGRSIDNLAPTAVKNFSGSPLGMTNRLAWKANTEPDMHSYAVYRSEQSSIDPNAVPPLATITDTVLTDNTLPVGDSYYFIRAKDIHGNYSPLRSLTSPLGVREVALTALVEGLYDENANSMVRDTVTVELRQGSSPYARVEQSKTFLNSTGAGAVRVRAAENTGNYYVVVKHRNAIETWSKQPQTMTDSRINYDFTTAATTAYGDNLKQKGTKWCIFSGDVNQDGIVDYSDLSAIDNDSYNYTGGYVATDLTGDEFVDYTDLTIADNNNFNYVSVQSPLALLKKGATAQADNTGVPVEYEVSRNYPNPFNPSTRINYALPQDSRVVLNLYNMLGEKIATLIDREEGAGYHTAMINMNNLPSGAYILHFTAGDYRKVQKIMLMK